MAKAVDGGPCAEELWVHRAPAGRRDPPPAGEEDRAAVRRRHLARL